MTITGGLPGISSSPPGVGSGPPYAIVGDMTMVLSGFAPVGSAVVGASTTDQALGGGTFEIRYGPTSSVLLSGTAGSAVLREENAASNANITSQDVTYTGGALYADMTAAGLSHAGTFVFPLINIDAAYGLVPVGGDVRLAGFSADGSGSFDAIPLAPEPGMGVIGAGVVALGAGARRRRE